MIDTLNKIVISEVVLSSTKVSKICFIDKIKDLCLDKTFKRSCLFIQIYDNNVKLDYVFNIMKLQYYIIEIGNHLLVIYHLHYKKIPVITKSIYNFFLSDYFVSEFSYLLLHLTTSSNLLIIIYISR